MTKPTCTCHPVPEQYHTTHYGATEPGSTLEPDYGCAVHFPRPGCCTACEGTGKAYDPQTNGLCWDCRGTGHPHDGRCE